MVVQNPGSNQVVCMGYSASVPEAWQSTGGPTSPTSIPLTQPSGKASKTEATISEVLPYELSPWSGSSSQIAVTLEQEVTKKAKARRVKRGRDRRR